MIYMPSKFDEFLTRGRAMKFIPIWIYPFAV